MQNLTGKNTETLARTLGADLLAANKKVATVESCTGGGVAFAITEVAGSSQWFEKSWVTYSNQAKHEEVGVNLATLAEYGAVSSEVVREMAQGGLRKSGADLCVSISGIAGPGGGSKAKPVGLVWFAIAMLQDKPKDSKGGECRQTVNAVHSSKLGQSASLSSAKDISQRDNTAGSDPRVGTDSALPADNDLKNPGSSQPNKLGPSSSIVKPGSSANVNIIPYTDDKSIYTRCFSRCFSGDRQQVREQAINLALKELIVSLVNT